MKRLTNVSVFFLTLMLGLGAISTPALAEDPWIFGPPQAGRGPDDDPPDPKGGPSTELIPENAVRLDSYYGLVMEISYYVAEFWVENTRTMLSEQDSLKEIKNTSIKVD